MIFTCSSITGRSAQARSFKPSAEATNAPHARSPSLGCCQPRCPPDEVDVNGTHKAGVRLRHSWRVLERLERAIAYTLKPFQPNRMPREVSPVSGPIKREANEASRTYFSEASEKPNKTPPFQRAGMAASPEVKPSPSVASPPAWAVAAGRQLNLVGQEAEEQVKVEKERPVSASPLGQGVLPNLPSTPVAAPLSSAERDLHRHAGKGATARPNEEAPLEGVLNDLPHMEPLA